MTESIHPSPDDITNKPQQTEPSSTTLEKSNSHPGHLANKKTAKNAFFFSLLAIILVIILGIAIFLHGHAQIKLIKNDSSALQSQLTQAQQQQNVTNTLLNQKMNVLEEENKKLQLNLLQQTNQLAQLQASINNITQTDQQTWLLAETKHYIKLADQKVKNEQDILTALTLLKDAQANLIQLNAPQLLILRKKVDQDILTLENLPLVDNSQLIFTLNELIQQVDQLPLKNIAANKEQTTTTSEITPSVSNWKSNLLKNTQKFIAQFISISKRQDKNKVLLSPDETIYLRENVKTYLLVALQSVQLQQDKVYQSALTTANTLIDKYFDTENENTKSWMTQLTKLKAHNIVFKTPQLLSKEEIAHPLSFVPHQTVTPADEPVQKEGE